MAKEDHDDLRDKSSEALKTSEQRVVHNFNKNRRFVCEQIVPRLKSEGVAFFANDTIHQYITDDERQQIQEDAEAVVQDLLRVLCINTDEDHNTKETHKRVAKMFVKELMSGRYTAPPSITAFPNVKNLNELILVGPIDVRSMCSHHLLPFIGSAYIGVLPGEKLIGLSKYNRVVDWFASRPQIQEEFTVQVADFLEKEMKPSGLMVVIKAKHLCGCARGIKQNSEMVTSVARGIFLGNPHTKAEFLELIKGMG